MSDTFRVSEHIARPVDEVWGKLTDWKQAPEWMNGIEEMRGPGTDNVAEGAKVVFPTRGSEKESTIAAWSPPHRLVLCSKQGGVTATYEYTCRSEGAGTRLKLHARCEMKGIGWRLTGPLVRYLIKRTDSGQISALKRVLESA